MITFQVNSKPDQKGRIKKIKRLVSTIKTIYHPVEKYIT